jgi:toxin ParE1/3/4
MKALPVRFREAAIADLVEITSFLRVQQVDEAVIRGFIIRIRKQCEKIGLAPEGYAARPDLGPGIRIAPFEKSAVIVFTITGNCVEITNIFYGGRDYAALLRS